MSLERTGLWLAAWVLVVLAASPGNAQPPEGRAVGDLQLFAPGEQASLGGGPRANQGLFFTCNGLYWTVSAPDTALFGAGTPSTSVPAFFGPDADSSVNQATTMNTGFIQSQWSGGQEITFGFVREHHGLVAQYFNLHGNSQDMTLAGVQAYFEDSLVGGGGGARGHLSGPTSQTIIDQPDPLPDIIINNFNRLLVEYDTVTLRNTNDITGVGLNYIYRQHPMMGGGIFEWLFGARYVQFHERFQVDALGGVLGDTVFDTDARNEIIGPEIGLRWFRRQERWTWSAQGSFTAGANFQNVRQDGYIASNLGNTFETTGPAVGELGRMRLMGFNYAAHMKEFSPIVDVKVELKWQATRALALNAGWSAMWIDNVARPSGMVNYALGNTNVMGIRTDHNRQDLFLTGLRAGLEFNR